MLQGFSFFLTLVTIRLLRANGANGAIAFSYDAGGLVAAKLNAQAKTQTPVSARVQYANNGMIIMIG